MRSRILFTLWLCLSLVACDDTAVQPDEEQPVEHNFRITAVSEDTVYLGERISIAVSELPVTVDSLQLFVHTHPVVIDSLFTDRVLVTLPANAESGVLRLYKTDSILAKGDWSLTILKQHIDSIRGEFTGLAPSQGYTGERILIGGIGLPLRSKDFELTINGVAHSIDAIDQFRVAFRVNEETATGPVVISALGTTPTMLGTFTKLTAGETDFLDVDLLRRVTISSSGLTGGMESMVVSDKGDTLMRLTSDAVIVNTNSTIIRAPVTITDDSVIVSWSENASLHQTVEIRLAKKKQDNTVSGVIRYTYFDNVTFGNPTQVTELHIKNMHWLKTNTSYMLYSYNTEITDQLTGLTFIESDPDKGQFERVMQYTGGRVGSWLQIQLNF